MRCSENGGSVRRTPPATGVSLIRRFEPGMNARPTAPTVGSSTQMPRTAIGSAIDSNELRCRRAAKKAAPAK